MCVRNMYLYIHCMRWHRIECIVESRRNHKIPIMMIYYVWSIRIGQISESVTLRMANETGIAKCARVTRISQMSR